VVAIPFRDRSITAAMSTPPRGSVSGNNDIVESTTGNSGTTITDLGNNLTLSASYDTLNMGVNNTSATVSGNNDVVESTTGNFGDVINLTNSITVNVTSTGDVINTATNDTVNATWDTINIGGDLATGISAGTSYVVGKNDLIQQTGNDTLYVSGLSGFLSAAIGDTIITSGHCNFDYINNATSITENPGAGLRLVGTNDDTIIEDGGNPQVGDIFFILLGPSTGDAITINGPLNYDEVPAGTMVSLAPNSSVTLDGVFDPNNSNSIQTINDTNYSENIDDCPDGGVDPIILNLQENAKVQTTSVSGSNTYFDMQNNGQKVQTGWATAGEGLLVYDPNNINTVTDDADLVAGFSALKSLAQKVDGTDSSTLNSSDALWSSLKVWVDNSGSGNFESEQLETLDKLGITSINLDFTSENQDNNGNTLLADSTFTWANGTTGDIAGVNLLYNPNSIQPQSSKPNPVVNNSLDSLISAMAAFAPPASAQTCLLDAASVVYQTPLLAASHG
jgi:trimeric autotransporter adhesin